MTTSSVSSSSNSSTTPSTASNASSSTSSGSTSTSSTANNSQLGQQILSSLGAGSGVNVSQLAQSLVNATELPQKNIINTRITSDQSKISGFSAVSYVVQEVQTAMSNLQNQSSFNNLTVSNSGTGTFTISTTAATPPGNHNITINSLASPQSVLSNGFSSRLQTLNGGNGFNIQITSASSTVPTVVNVSAGSDSPQGIVDAINTSPNNGGISAVLVNTGSPTNPFRANGFWRDVVLLAEPKGNIGLLFGQLIGIGCCGAVDRIDIPHQPRLIGSSLLQPIDQFNFYVFPQLGPEGQDHRQEKDTQAQKGHAAVRDEEKTFSNVLRDDL